MWLELGTTVHVLEIGLNNSYRVSLLYCPSVWPTNTFCHTFPKNYWTRITLYLVMILTLINCKIWGLFRSVRHLASYSPSMVVLLFSLVLSDSSCLSYMNAICCIIDLHYKGKIILNLIVDDVHFNNFIGTYHLQLFINNFISLICRWHRWYYSTSKIWRWFT